MIDKKTVEYIANLAKIEISDQEFASLSSQLSKILDYIDKLKELDVENIKPIRHIYLKSNVFRDDKVENFNLNKDILNNAPLIEENYFKIPLIL